MVAIMAAKMSTSSARRGSRNDRGLFALVGELEGPDISSGCCNGECCAVGDAGADGGCEEDSSEPARAQMDDFCGVSGGEQATWTHCGTAAISRCS